MSSKKCTYCKEKKELSEFYKNIKNKDGYSFWCKDCSKIYAGFKKKNTEKYHTHEKYNWHKSNK